MIFEPMVRSAQTVHLYIAPTLAPFPNGPKWASTWPTHQGAPLVASRMISEPMVRSAQTTQLSCVKISTISKRTQMSFHLSLVTLEYHQLCPKWFSSLRYIQRKPCTYLVSRLSLSPNETKWACPWALSPRSIVECVQINFWANGTFGAKCAPILHQH
jgi:hypothetical protein